MDKCSSIMALYIAILRQPKPPPEWLAASKAEIG